MFFDLAGLSEGVTVHVLGLLSPEDILTCGVSCAFLRDVSSKDTLWKQICARDYGFLQPVAPPGRDGNLPSCRLAWVSWKRSFIRYDAGLVRRMYLWWETVESWLLNSMPDILWTLAPGVDDAALDSVERRLGGVPLPPAVRLLYRFHNGQRLTVDNFVVAGLGANSGQEPPPASLTAAALPAAAADAAASPMAADHDLNILKAKRREGGGVVASASRGLFGGHSFYGRCACMKFHSLARLEQTTRTLVRREWAQRLPPPERRQLATAVAFASGLDYGAAYVAGADGRVFIAANNVFLRCVSDLDTAPGVDPGNVAASDEERRTLLPWLDEYARRLTSGCYAVRPLWPSVALCETLLSCGWRPDLDTSLTFHDDDGMPPPAPVVARAVLGISLFPETAAEGCSERVTHGVRVRVSALFCPMAARSHETLWTYSVRIRLLREHPSRPAGMISCQLTRRRWIITDLEGHAEEVEGPGVIGLMPLLSIVGEEGDGPPFPFAAGEFRYLSLAEPEFAYQSCTTMPRAPGTMRGYLTFVPGSVAAPTGPPFLVEVGEFPVAHPRYLFV